MNERSPERQLDDFISRYTPAIGALARSALATMRKRLPGAIELVYDNYNALVIGFGPTERASEAVFSIAVYPRWVNLFFLDGVNLPDPYGLLEGSGKQVRRIVLEDARTLDRPPVRALMRHALAGSAKQIDKTAPNRIVIKSISAKRRPRRPSSPDVARGLVSRGRG